MGWLDAIGWPKTPEPEQRMITAIPGIERPGFDWAAITSLNGIELPIVTTDSALTVPAVLAAVSFLSRSLASLPLHAYRSTQAGGEKMRKPGTKGAPTAKAFKQSAKTAKKK